MQATSANHLSAYRLSKKKTCFSHIYIESLTIGCPGSTTLKVTCESNGVFTSFYCDLFWLAKSESNRLMHTVQCAEPWISIALNIVFHGIGVPFFWLQRKACLLWFPFELESFPIWWLPESRNGIGSLETNYPQGYAMPWWNPWKFACWTDANRLLYLILNLIDPNKFRNLPRNGERTESWTTQAKQVINLGLQCPHMSLESGKRLTSNGQLPRYNPESCLNELGTTPKSSSRADKQQDCQDSTCGQSSVMNRLPDFTSTTSCSK